ncbi:hypothetical protein KDJ21_002700 [Metabacillus litoralis]|uniref:hypothetical protein n=1 Tax=Metabacillus litoralis TaxID=152268 RepID=UPI001BA371A5|nr:hypothetical protein [Metabacillus litoralis]UHA60660.1 hypothetical protein KDJ21_002700 [Metabacillus litoralis]
MDKAESFFQTLEHEPKGLWIPASKEVGNSYGSHILVGEDLGACIGKYGKYHVFSRTSGIDKLGNQMWVVNTHTKEVRRVNGEYKRKELKEVFVDN